MVVGMVVQLQECFVGGDENVGVSGRMMLKKRGQFDDVSDDMIQGL